MMLSLSFLSGQITTLLLYGEPGNETIKDGGKHLRTFIQTSVLISPPPPSYIFYMPFVISPHFPFSDGVTLSAYLKAVLKGMSIFNLTVMY